jgi:hypothetical protein
LKSTAFQPLAGAALSKGGRKAAQIHEQPAQLHSIRGIDVEHADRSSTALCLANQPGATPSEVTIPSLASGMKERYNLAAHPPRQVGAFSQVATLAAPSEVRRNCLASVLPWDNVLHVKRKRFVVLMDAAVFAARDCP